MIEGYSNAENETYNEAVRLVPALQAARLRGGQADSDLLLKAYLAEARERGLDNAGAWAIMCGAQSMAVLSLITLVADIQETTKADVIERMVEAALEQVASGAV